MASLHKETQHGREVWRIAFYDRDGNRRKIRLGGINKRVAQTIAMRVQQLADFVFAGMAPDAELTGWLSKIGKELIDKLAAAGLVAPSEPAEAAKVLTLTSVLDAYLSAPARGGMKPSTRCNLDQARNSLVEHFGADRDVRSITAGDADEWRAWLGLAKPAGKGLSTNTIRRQCGRAKQMFRYALRKRLIAESPFSDMKDTNVKANKDRDYFVTREMATKVLEACPDADWRLIVALARYAGLRTPSETLALRWGDIDWENARMTITSPKTEHHTGKGKRVIPLFPELRPYLESAWEAAAEGAEFVVSRYRDKNVNLRTQMERIIELAGLTSWPKLFQNLRASRATELAAEYPAHVAAAWLGHSRVVAAEHYWRVTDADFAKAVGVSQIADKPKESAAQ